MVSLLLPLLGSCHLSAEVFCDFLECHSMVASSLVYNGPGISYRARFYFFYLFWVVVVVCEEWRDARCFRSLIISCGFCTWQPLSPIVLKVVDKTP